MDFVRTFHIYHLQVDKNKCELYRSTLHKSKTFQAKVFTSIILHKLKMFSKAVEIWLLQIYTYFVILIGTPSIL